MHFILNANLSKCDVFGQYNIYVLSFTFDIAIRHSFIRRLAGSQHETKPL